MPKSDIVPELISFLRSTQKANNKRSIGKDGQKWVKENKLNQGASNEPDTAATEKVFQMVCEHTCLQSDAVVPDAIKLSAV